MAVKLSLICNILLSALLVGVSAALVRATDEDAVRITLTSDQIYGYKLGPFVHDLQDLTGKEAIAVRLNGTSDANATKWQLRLEDRKEVNEGSK